MTPRGVSAERWHRFTLWFFEGLREPQGPHAKAAHQSVWWKVMCLTGVDYFSTLGYQPGIAFLAAGSLSPLATLVLVLLTLFGALPMYRRVAALSPHGQGSISLLEELLPRWRGKALVLCLLGFAATGFVITITLSAADATAHIIENPLAPAWLRHPIVLTLVLLAALGAIFLKGFREAIGLAVPIVVVYLVLNVIVVGWGVRELWQHPEAISNWRAAVFAHHPSVAEMVFFALLLFPKLALGLSGFETGVAVMPLVRGEPGDTPEHPEGRIRNARKLLTTAAAIMSVMLIGSSIVTTLFIPAEAFQHGGEAYGRALAYLAHEHLGHAVRDALRRQHGGHSLVCRRIGAGRFDQSGPAVSAAVWHGARLGAGHSATGGDFRRHHVSGHHPVRSGCECSGWRLRDRRAGVDGIGGVGGDASRRGASSSAWRGYAVLTVIFAYTTIVNIAERPAGIKIAAMFIASIVVSSFVSRVWRSTELRVHEVRAR